MKRLLSAILVALSISAVSATSDSYYLFVYFSDDTTEGQQVKYAVSNDGLNFTPLNAAERYAGKNPSLANADWAPQTIFDPLVGKYMVYFSLHSEKNGPYPVDKVFYAYANDNFSDLETDPVPLFDFDGPAIDSDIVCDDNSLYHLFFNTWGGGKTMR